MGEECPLILKPTYVYNPTNHWFQCNVSYEEQQFPIKCLPPRSCRNFPPTFLSPSIKSFSQLPPGGLSKMKSSSSIEKINEYVLSLNLISTFEGSIIFVKEPYMITANISIKGESLVGWFQQNSNLFFMKGIINAKTHEVRMSIFGSSEGVYKNVLGKIVINDGKVNIYASLGKFTLSLNASVDKSLKPVEEPSLCGNYMGFKESETQDQEDLYLTITSTTDGFVHADVVDGNKNKFALIGCRSTTDNVAFLLTESDCNLQFFGEITGNNNDLTIVGTWKENKQVGSFSFLKSQN